MAGIAEDFGLGAVLLGSFRTVPLALSGVDPGEIVPLEPILCDTTFCLTARREGGFDVTFEPHETGRVSREIEALIGEQRRSIRIDGTGITRALHCWPERISFGEIDAAECSERAVLCRNEGDQQLSMQIALSADVGFRIGATEASLGEGEAIDLGVEFCPLAAGVAEATLHVGDIAIPLRAITGGPRIRADPPELDFGEISSFTTSRRDLRLAGVGVEIARVETTRPEIRVQQLEGGLWRVEIQPQNAAEIAGEILVASNDPIRPELHISVHAMAVPLDNCGIGPAPRRVDVGLVPRRATRRLHFEFNNFGLEECLIGPLQSARGNSRIRSIDPTASVRVAQGDKVVRGVEYTAPANGNEQIVLHADISNAARSEEDVMIFSTVGNSWLDANETEVDFGVLPVVCGIGQSFTLHPIREMILNRVELTQPSDEFTVTGRLPSPGAPIMLASGEALRPRIEFRSFAAGGFARFLAIEATVDGVLERQTISLRAEARAEPTQVDEFEQRRFQTDILWVIDNSCSMRDESPLDEEQIRDFIAAFDSRRTDYRIAVTTSDTLPGGSGGLLRERPSAPGEFWVTPASKPSPAEAVIELANAGTDGSGVERGLSALERVVLDSAGLLRDSVLLVVFFSDEDDQTIEAPETLFNRVQASLQERPWAPIAVIGRPPDGCNTGTKHAAPGPRYQAFVSRVGFASQSICDDWSRFFLHSENGAFGLRSTFRLTRSPILETIRILVDGMPVTQVSEDGTMRWTFEVETSSIRFAPSSVPPAGSKVRIEYRAGCG